MANPGTPDWWLDRLYGVLRSRQLPLRDYDRWFEGENLTPAGYEKAQDMLLRLLESVGANTLPMLVRAAQERMVVEGFKASGQIETRMWEIWQGNGFDAESRKVFLERMALGRAFVLVDPNRNDAGYPTITAEHPTQCVVAVDPRLRTRVAALKVWFDDLGPERLIRAVVYLPGSVTAYAAPTRLFAWTVQPGWDLQPEESGPNPLGEVPLVEFANRPRLVKEPRPEWWPALNTQKRINKTLLDRMVMQDSGAFKALWATGLQIPVNPATGKPVEDFVRAVDRMFVNENPDGRFGQLQAEDIRMMLEAVAEDMRHAAALVPTPPDYLLGSMVNVSAEGLKAAQASLISRIREHQANDEEPLETVARLALRAAGADVPNVSSMTTVWRNPEFRTEGELVDALVKMRTLGVPLAALWERWGATPQEIEAWQAQLAAEAMDPVTAELLTRTALPALPPTPPSPEPTGVPGAPAAG